jgi:predicted MFS family arabinose efflux permease
MGILVSQCVGAALAAGLLTMDGIGGLAGWQWLFLIEGLLCILVSAYWLFVMPRSIETMTFITEEERDALVEVMERQKLAEARHDGYWSQIKAAMRNPITLVASLWNFFYFM